MKGRPPVDDPIEEGTDPELQDLLHSIKVEQSPSDTSVASGVVFILVAEIAMRVDLHDRQLVRHNAEQSLDNTFSQAVLTAENPQKTVGPINLRHFVGDPF